MRKLHLFLLATFTILANNSVNAQEKILDDSEKYLLKYSTIAVEQMEKYGIPASITLAQGLLESGAGKSKLAIEANNHFGIKADNRWDGETYSSFDNGNWHKFRVYDNAEKSFPAALCLGSNSPPCENTLVIDSTPSASLMEFSSGDLVTTHPASRSASISSIIESSN